MSELFDGRKRGPVPRPTSEECRRVFAEVWEALEREAPARAPRAPRTPAKEREYRERAKLRRRLRSLGARVDDLVAALGRIHGDRAGWFHYMPPPLCEEEWHGSPRAPGISPAFERVKRDAESGCVLSASFVRDYETIVLLCDHLRHEKPPGRSPDWRPDVKPQVHRGALADNDDPEDWGW